MNLAEAKEIVEGNYVLEMVLERIQPYLPEIRVHLREHPEVRHADTVAEIILLLHDFPDAVRALLERTIQRETGDSVDALARRARSLEQADPEGAEALRVVLLAALEEPQ